jgi:hypothetical protein
MPMPIRAVNRIRHEGISSVLPPPEPHPACRPETARRRPAEAQHGWLAGPLGAWPGGTDGPIVMDPPSRQRIGCAGRQYGLTAAPGSLSFIGDFPFLPGLGAESCAAHFRFICLGNRLTAARWPRRIIQYWDE